MDLAEYQEAVEARVIWQEEWKQKIGGKPPHSVVFDAEITATGNPDSEAIDEMTVKLKTMCKELYAEMRQDELSALKLENAYAYTADIEAEGNADNRALDAVTTELKSMCKDLYAEIAYDHVATINNATTFINRAVALAYHFYGGIVCNNPNDENALEAALSLFAEEASRQSESLQKLANKIRVAS